MLIFVDPTAPLVSRAPSVLIHIREVTKLVTRRNPILSRNVQQEQTSVGQTSHMGCGGSKEEVPVPQPERKPLVSSDELAKIQAKLKASSEAPASPPKEAFKRGTHNALRRILLHDR